MEPAVKEITLQLDNQEVKAKEGETILDVAKRLNISIPTLCFVKALSPFGACRLCSVEIVEKKWEKSHGDELQLSCYGRLGRFYEI